VPGRTGVWIRGFVLAKQVLYFLSHTSSSFCSGYYLFIFWWHWGLKLGPHSCKACTLPAWVTLPVTLVILELFARAGLKLWSFYLSLPSSSHEPPAHGFKLYDTLEALFLCWPWADHSVPLLSCTHPLLHHSSHETYCSLAFLAL
jgi:hypothetical protein